MLLTKAYEFGEVQRLKNKCILLRVSSFNWRLISAFLIGNFCIIYFRMLLSLRCIHFWIFGYNWYSKIRKDSDSTAENATFMLIIQCSRWFLKLSIILIITRDVFMVFVRAARWPRRVDYAVKGWGRSELYILYCFSRFLPVLEVAEATYRVFFFCWSHVV